jgi:transcriptional regulator with XRE-family HTH domain
MSSALALDHQRRAYPDRGFSMKTRHDIDAQKIRRRFMELLWLHLSARKIDHPLTNKIRNVRKQKTWTLKKLSEVSGVPYNSIWRMERGDVPGLIFAYRVADALRTTVYELWGIPPSGHAMGKAKTKQFSVRELRKNRGWSLDALSELSGVSKSTIFSIEQGHTPTLETAVRIAAVLGVSVYQLWTADTTHENAFSVNEAKEQTCLSE